MFWRLLSWFTRGSFLLSKWHPQARCLLERYPLLGKRRLSTTPRAWLNNQLTLGHSDCFQRQECFFLTPPCSNQKPRWCKGFFLCLPSCVGFIAMGQIFSKYLTHWTKRGQSVLMETRQLVQRSKRRAKASSQCFGWLRQPSLISPHKSYHNRILSQLSLWYLWCPGSWNANELRWPTQRLQERH